MKNTTPTDSLHLDVEQPAHGDRIKEVLKSPFFDVLMLFFLFVFSSLSVGSLLALFDYFLGISFFVGGVSNPLDLGTLLIALPLLGSFYLVLFTSNSFMTLGYKVRYEIKVLVSATVTGLLLASGVFEVIAHLPASPPPDWNLDFIQGTQELVEPTANSFFSILGGAVTESFTLPFLVLTAALTVTARLLLIAQDILGNSPIGQRDLVASRRNRVERLERRIRNVLSSSRLRAAIVDVPIYEEGSSNEWGLICRYWHSLAARFVTHLVLSAIVVALLPNGDPKYAILFPAALSFFLLPAVE